MLGCILGMESWRRSGNASGVSATPGGRSRASGHRATPGWGDDRTGRCTHTPREGQKPRVDELAPCPAVLLNGSKAASTEMPVQCPPPHPQDPSPTSPVYPLCSASRLHGDKGTGTTTPMMLEPLLSCSRFYFIFYFCY